ncbi:SDR family oxidoreductase [Flexivirga sp. ID2601S]|uniref:SDR family oxidoreductase n=1 Tax=Flexivirga aerilata TaxID=1656889 RepID=A0A849AKI7_9MICO|nr:SDR family NAD(P)-dependent oxidoreductase [Flexivirga aerilata]NNG40879.1 SDR family oxidoreductase [Flexivirga aerilata]
MHQQFDLTGKRALVTGGGVGIGAAIAAILADAGAQVAVSYRTHAPDETVIAGLGSGATAFALDATDDNAVAAALGKLGAEWGGLDILVNNVGGLVQRSTIADMSPQLWHTVMALNADSTFLVTHHALPLLADGGRIINIASLAGRTGGHPGATAYAASKAAIFGFTRGLAKEVADRRITVNAVAPGFIEDTPFHDTFTTPDSKEQTVDTIPLGRAGRPQDVAAAVLWLASDGAEFVTGTVTDVNGGQHFG